MHPAGEAFVKYGKGRHTAGLNFGDCFSYALAKATGEPLVKGDDFSKTDLIRTRLAPPFRSPQRYVLLAKPTTEILPNESSLTVEPCCAFLTASSAMFWTIHSKFSLPTECRSASGAGFMKSMA